MELQLAQLGPEARIVARLRPGRLELLERRDQRLGHVPAAEVAIDPPAALRVGVEERLRDRRRTRPDVGPVEARGAGPLDEQSHAKRVLAGLRAGGSRRAMRARRSSRTVLLDAGADVDADGGHFQDRGADVARVQAAGQDDGHFAGHGRGDRSIDQAAGPAGERASGGIENDSLGAGSESTAPVASVGR